VTVRQRWLTTIAWTLIGSLAATFAFSGATWQMPWREVAQRTFATMLIAGGCVILCEFGLPIVAPIAHRRLASPFDWLAIVAALLVFGTIGSLFGAGAILALGLSGGDRFVRWYPNALKVSLYFTLIFGLSGTIIHELRGRLARTTLALRTTERDEAHARRLVAEAQLASLEARVDPHFLFNTLNSIAALVRDRPADAERVIEQLSSLMRSSLDRRVSLVPLDDELDVMRSYLEIERVRFGNRLRFSIEPLAGDAPLVPRLSLQTLAENCVKYAVSTSREGASIAVRATAQDGRLHVAVEDDGPGFDVSQLPEGHGLRLLQARLAMMFGTRARLDLRSRPGRTTVALDLPFETMPPAPIVSDAARHDDRVERSCL
jgi:signal transduction histidine kinase